VDALRRDDLERARATPPEQRAAQALAMMRAGYRLKLVALHERHPDASEDEIEARMRRWLACDD
jgi:hypothetical protein